MTLAEFKCWRCGHEWRDKPGPTDSLTGEPRTCPVCGNEYMTWTNYHQDFERKKK